MVFRVSGKNIDIGAALHTTLQSARAQLAPFVTHTLPLDRINEAFDLMHEGKSIRAVIHY